jgi:hypothetical protein
LTPASDCGVGADYLECVVIKRRVGIRFGECGLDSKGAAGLCQVHHARWARHGRPPVEAWLAACALFSRDRFDLRALPVPMRLEIAYAIQQLCLRYDDFSGYPQE